ncbi:GNAT family N-acetyltransferase [Marinicaulis aureus]|uniref:GNAT family N-acetyltransferase n=1 Tax=Hyphococcus aureus TaxID=2666033 RepID=A0ABW1KUM2_9PROT
MTIPTLQTARLTLRAPSKDDFSVYRDFYADKSASLAYGGPLPAHLAFRKLAADLGHWQLRDYGMWAVEEKTSGEMVGGAGLVWPEGWPRSELTWWIIPSARRNGYALEASRAVIAYAYKELQWAQVETHMNDDNEAARNLALKLGGRVIVREKFPDGYARDVYLLPAL